MRKFMSSHSFPAGGLEREQICQFAEAAQHDDDVRGYRSFVNLSEGKACCVLEANDREAVAAWFRRMGLPFDFITEVELEGDRGEIRDVMEAVTAR
jgi:hypothetical protein